MKCRGDRPGWVALLLIGIVGGVTGVPAIPGGASDEDTGQNCTHWNTPKFFKTASVEDVTACLKAGANPKAQDEDGRTPLHHIAHGIGNSSLVAALLQSGANPNARAKRGWTPLHGAALSAASNMETSSPDIISALIKAGADPNARDTSGETPLFKAAWFGCQESRHHRCVGPGRPWLRELAPTPTGRLTAAEGSGLQTVGGTGPGSGTRLGFTADLVALRELNPQA